MSINKTKLKGLKICKGIITEEMGYRQYCEYALKKVYCLYSSSPPFFWKVCL